MKLPSGFITASDRADEGLGEETLNLWGDFQEMDTISLRREHLPPSLATSLATLPPAEAAAALTAEERDAVAADAAAARGGQRVVNNVGRADASTSGRLAFDVISAARLPSGYLCVELASEQCRGTVEETHGGRLICLGPRGDELATTRRHALVVYAPKGEWLYVLRASASEDRWAGAAPALRLAAESFDASNVVHHV